MHFNRFDLNLLVALDALLQEKNVTRAAERLFISQPAMSGALQRLRERLDDPLLVRVGRNMELTPKAKALIRPVREILLQIRNTIEAEPQFNPKTARRSFTIAMSDFVSVAFMPAVMRRVLRDAPGVRLHLVPISTRSHDQLESGELNLLVRARVDQRLEQQLMRDDLESELLFTDEWVCAADADHPSLGDELTLEDYLQLPHVSLNLGKSVATIEEVTLTQHSLDVEIVATAQNFATLIFMLPGTPLLTLISRRMARIMSERVALKTYPPPFEVPPLEEKMIWHTRNAQDEGHRWLRAVFREVANELK